LLQDGAHMGLLLACSCVLMLARVHEASDWRVQLCPARLRTKSCMAGCSVLTQDNTTEMEQRCLRFYAIRS
jgi:hypothetical protein